MVATGVGREAAVGEFTQDGGGGDPTRAQKRRWWFCDHRMRKGRPGRYLLKRQCIDNICAGRYQAKRRRVDGVARGGPVYTAGKLGDLHTCSLKVPDIEKGFATPPSGSTANRQQSETPLSSFWVIGVAAGGPVYTPGRLGQSHTCLVKAVEGRTRKRTLHVGDVGEKGYED